MINKSLGLVLFTVPLMAIERGGKQFVVSGDKILGIDWAERTPAISLYVNGKQVVHEYLAATGDILKACVSDFCGCGTYAASIWSCKSTDPALEEMNVVEVYHIPRTVTKKELVFPVRLIYTLRASFEAKFHTQATGCKFRVDQHRSGQTHEVASLELDCKCAFLSPD